MQWALNLYIDSWNKLGLLLHRERKPYAYAEEIAVQSTELMETHYDQPQELFDNFLGGIMKYSMGLWDTGAASLEESQVHMLDDLCEKAELEDGQALLDIGCGFGSFVEHALRKYPNATVFGLSLSKVQCDYMRAMQNTPGHTLHTDRFRLVEGDFNTVRIHRQFDRIVSIGVFEHVSNLGRALQSVRSMLMREGQCFLHYIVFRSPLDRLPYRPPECNFFHRYLFPGGRIWFDQELYNYQDGLRIDRYWYINGSNYRHTLQAWLTNLLRNWDRIQATGKFDAKHLKVWEFYLRVCIGVFSSGRGEYYGNGQYLLKHG